MTKYMLMQQPSSKSPIDEYLLEIYPENLEILLITGKDSKRIQFHEKTNVVYLDDYFSEESFGQICEIVESFKPDFIASNSEKDVYRVSCLRSLFNIKGLKSNFGIMFRNKVKMKHMFKMAGIPYTPFCHPFSIEEVLDFQSSNGKIVLKPISGAGSVGVEIFESNEAIINFFKNKGKLFDLFSGNIIVEKFIDGDVYHIDILSYRNEPLLILPSKYFHPPHKYLYKNIGGYLLDEESSDYNILKGFSEKLMGILPKDECVSTIHFEVLRDSEGNFFAGEIAARSGGGMIKDNIKQSYNIDISLAGYDLWISPENLLKQLSKKRDKLSYAYFMVTSEEYDVEKLGDITLENNKLWISENQSTEQASSSVDAKAGILLQGKNEQDILNQIDIIERRIKKENFYENSHNK